MRCSLKQKVRCRPYSCHDSLRIMRGQRTGAAIRTQVLIDITAAELTSGALERSRHTPPLFISLENLTRSAGSAV